MFGLVLIDIVVSSSISINGFLLTFHIDQTRLKLIQSAITCPFFHLIILINLICIVIDYVYASQIQILINFYLLDQCLHQDLNASFEQRKHLDPVRDEVQEPLVFSYQIKLLNLTLANFQLVLSSGGSSLHLAWK